MSRFDAFAPLNPMVHAPVRFKVLIVEDDADSCDALARLLRRVGHEVECAKTAGEALVKLEEWAPQYVLLDLMLPDASGGLVLRKVRNQQLPIKVAVITAAGKNSPIVRQAVGYDPDIVFEKPLIHKELLQWIDSIATP
jgi:CheY-like chemotaxis protein